MLLRLDLVFAGTVLLFAALVWARNRVADDRIRRAGGARAPILAGNFFSASWFYFNVGKNQLRNNLPNWCDQTLDALPGSQHAAEFSLTGKKRVLITREPEQIKAVLATKFASFGHGSQWHKLWGPFLGDGIFATDGQQWHNSRSMIRPMFARDRLRNLTIFDYCTDKLLSKLPRNGETVDLKNLFYRWSLDAATEFLLGENVNSLDNPVHGVANAMTTAQRIQMLIFVLNPIAPLIPKGAYLKAIGCIESFIEPIISRALALSENELDELSKLDIDFTFLHSIARFSKEPKVLRDEIMSVLLAARDTTAATMSWAVYELSNCPDAWTQLRREVIDALGVEKRPTYETLKNLKSVRNILNETLRLHPVVPLNMRQALETTAIPGPPGEPDVVLLKGDTVTINTSGLHKRRDLYPPTSKTFADPLTFSPDRWNHWTPRPWTYLPFSGGPRICVGQNFALTEMAYCR
ncbi:hypothetical protein JDV02_005937 [Purpureocillium takamizusanense]|uniref:Cytochrome P450 alkane hydroxylase n=1 Tax=Purpureocillium takamizusanense TaxID=2060973 RepID=A0A9Q8QII5_9HYPO|nr:uncharacterized protein JDV02_005937 [Purpureocillium takamizusanense]UNI19781.1 hypothetical protein JDV02_005937 [Purpureocillium takamizusanense]